MSCELRMYTSLNYKMENITLTLLLILTSIFCVVGTNPGIVIRVNNQGLAYGKLIFSVNIIAFQLGLCSVEIGHFWNRCLL